MSSRRPHKTSVRREYRNIQQRNEFLTLHIQQHIFCKQRRFTVFTLLGDEFLHMRILVSKPLFRYVPNLSFHNPESAIRRKRERITFEHDRAVHTYANRSSLPM